MKLAFKNIGIIKNAEIDLSKDLIILSGPNNSGKTYASYLIYALHRYIHKEDRGFGSILDIAVDITELSSKGTLNLDLYKLFSENKDAISTQFADFVKKRLPDVFDANNNVFKTTLLKIIFNSKYVKNELLKGEFERTIAFSNSTTTFSKKANSSEVSIVAVFSGSSQSLKAISGILNIILSNVIGEILLQQIFKNCYIAPAERLAINLFSRQLSVQRNKLVEDLLAYPGSKNTKGILAKAQLYPLAIRDCLEVSERLVEFQKNTSDFDFLATLIETEILKGKIKVSKEGDIQYTPQDTRLKPLGIHLTASVVKSLSSLVFYFRHLAKKNDFIIIDEPELNLHPDNQIKVARLISMIVNSGFKVMISTHSDYIIREINNLIMLSQESDAAKKIIKKYKYNTNQLLKPQQVSAYLFKDKQVTELEISNTGFEVETIDNEVSTLNTISEEIYFTLS